MSVFGYASISVPSRKVTMISLSLPTVTNSTIPPQKTTVKVDDCSVLVFKHLDEVRQPFALSFLRGNGGRYLIVPPDQPIVAFLILVLVLRNAGVLCHYVLRHFHKYRHLFLPLPHSSPTPQYFPARSRGRFPELSFPH